MCLSVSPNKAIKKNIYSGTGKCPLPSYTQPEWSAVVDEFHLPRHRKRDITRPFSLAITKYSLLVQKIKGHWNNAVLKLDRHQTRKEDRICDWWHWNKNKILLFKMLILLICCCSKIFYHLYPKHLDKTDLSICMERNITILKNRLCYSN